MLCVNIEVKVFINGKLVDRRVAHVTLWEFPYEAYYNLEIVYAFSIMQGSCILRTLRFLTEDFGAGEE